MSKGPAFEREFAKTLSLWWTGGKHDDVFWRSHGSGARATSRQKTGKATRGQYGDITFTHPIGAPLIDLLTIELKKGYVKTTFANTLDRLPAHFKNPEPWTEWYLKTVNSHRLAGSAAWMIVTRRTNRVTLVFMPTSFVRTLVRYRFFASVPKPWVTFTPEIRYSKDDVSYGNVTGFGLHHWWAASPKRLLKITTYY
jgi:hypothetical protein